MAKKKVAKNGPKNKKLKVFRIPVSWTVTANVDIEAEDLDDAIGKAESPDFPLPTDTEYVSGSFSVDHDLLRSGDTHWGEQNGN